MDADYTSSPDRPGPPPTGIEARLQIVVEDFLATLQAGERPDRAQAVAEHPELAPWLDERLKLVELVFQAAQDGNADHRHFPGDRAKRLKCPHCGNQVQLVEPRNKEVTCLNCGSSFRVEPDATATYQSSRPAGEFGRFQVIELLGRGAFGEVYKARDRELDRFVALKVPRADYFANSEETQRFLREARAAAGLRHVSIVQVHEIAHERGSPYIVSDYIEGLTLADLISGGRPGFRESAELLAQLADAVDYAHRQKVIHRDIKPSNILLTSPEGKNAVGPQFIPFLTDFGLARRDEGEITVTLDGQVLGTPAYMSPEQAAGDHARVDGRSDVYSLGVVLYELLSGELPFRGSRRMLLHQVLHDEPRPPRTLNDRIPRDLETICLKAMAKEPSRRYHTAADFRDDLRRYLRGDPITARRVGRMERTWRWARRNPGLAATTSLAIVALVATAVVSVLFAAYYAGASSDITQKASDLREALHDSEEHRTRAQQLALLADERAETAKTEAAKAKEAEQQALNEKDRSEQLRYIAEINAAVRDYDAGSIAAARQRLASLTPADAKAKDRRHFEWFYLDGLFNQELRVFAGHEGSVQSLAFSADSRMLASAGADGTIRLWNPATGKELAVLRGHDGPVEAVFFNLDGRRLISVGADASVRVWDVESKSEVSRVGDRHEKPQCVAFTPDWKRMSTVGSDHVLRVWQLEPLTELRSLGAIESRTGPGVGSQSAIFSPEGRQIALHERTLLGGPVQVWEVESGKAIWAFDLPSNSSANPANRAPRLPVSPPRVQWTAPTCRLAYSPDGRHIAIPSQDRTVRIVNSETGQEEQILLGHTNTVTCVAYKPDGTVIASGGLDNVVRVWDPVSGGELAALRGHSSGVLSVAFSSNGRWLASAGMDGSVRLWNPELDTAMNHGRPQYFDGGGAGTLAFSTTGVRAARSNAVFVGVVEPQLGARRLILQGRGLSDTLGGAWAFSRDGRSIVAQTKDKAIRLWEADTGRLIKILEQESLEAVSLIFSDDGRFVGGVSGDGSARIWSAEDGDIVAILRPPSGKLTAIRFAPDGEHVTSAGDDNCARLWDLRSGSQSDLYSGTVGDTPVKVTEAILSPDGKKFIAVTTNEIFGSFLWKQDVDGSNALGLPATVFGAISPDWKRMVVARNGHAELVDARSGDTISILAHNESDDFASYAFSSDGRRLVTGAMNGAVCLWDSETGRPLISLIGRNEYGQLPPTVAIAWNPDDSQVAAGNMVSSYWIWNGRRNVLHNRNSREAMEWTRYLIREAKSESELRARLAEDPAVSDGVRTCAAELAGPMWRAEVQHRVEAALKTAREREQNREWDSAVETYCQAVQLDPEYADAYSGRAASQYGRGNYAEAIADYSEAIRLDPNNVPTLVSRANVRRWKRDFKNALADYDEAIRLDPKNCDAYVGRGTTFSVTEEYDRALADFDRAIDIEPQSAMALGGRAWIRATCRDEKYRDGGKAVDDATKACELADWKSFGFLETLAAAYAESGRFEKAIEWEEKAVEFAPDAEKEASRSRLKLYRAGEPYRVEPKN